MSSALEELGVIPMDSTPLHQIGVNQTGSSLKDLLGSLRRAKLSCTRCEKSPLGTE